MLQIRVNAAAMQRVCVTYALALLLGFAGIASADSIDVAGIASANSVEIAGIARGNSAEIAEIAPATSVDSAEIATVNLSDDAMPQGPSVADRLAVIREKIQNALEYPPLARLHDSDGDALVRFEIDRLGSAENIRVVRSSGNDRLDTSAVHAVETASPLPWVYGPLEVPVHFELTASH